jgi:hypothetical protein
MVSCGRMAWRLRIEVAGAWYPVVIGGYRGGALFLDDGDRRRFLGSVSESSVRRRLWRGVQAGYVNCLDATPLPPHESTNR